MQSIVSDDFEINLIGNEQAELKQLYMYYDIARKVYRYFCILLIIATTVCVYYILFYTFDKVYSQDQGLYINYNISTPTQAKAYFTTRNITRRLLI
jgi:hypothetical protein